MPSDVVYRSKSQLCLPRARSVEREAKVGTLTRVTSVPSLSTLRVGDSRYRPSTLYKYRRDWDLMGPWESDRLHYYPYFHWKTWRYAARRPIDTDAPYPGSLGFQEPAFWSKYKWYTDWLNPTYWRKHRDPNYDRPLWNAWRPWQMDSKNVKRAIDLYRNGIVPFTVLDRNWIEPWALGRKTRDWADVYLPAARYGAHRYFYKFD